MTVVLSKIDVLRQEGYESGMDSEVKPISRRVFTSGLTGMNGTPCSGIGGFLHRK